MERTDNIITQSIGIDVGTHSTKVCYFNNDAKILRIVEREHSIQDMAISKSELDINLDELLHEIINTIQFQNDQIIDLSFSILGEAFLTKYNDQYQDEIVLGLNNIGKEFYREHPNYFDSYLYNNDKNYFYSVFKQNEIIAKSKEESGIEFLSVEEYLLEYFGVEKSISETSALRTGKFFFPNFKNHNLDQAFNHMNNPVRKTGSFLDNIKFSNIDMRVYQGTWDIHSAIIGSALKKDQLLINFGSVLISAFYCNSISVQEPIFHSIPHEKIIIDDQIIDVNLFYSPGLIFNKILQISNMQFSEIPDNPVELDLTRDIKIIEEILRNEGVNRLQFISKPVSISQIQYLFEICANEIIKILNSANKNGVKINSLVCTGGIANCKLWHNLLSNLTKKKIYHLQTNQASAVGAALIPWQSNKLNYSAIPRQTEFFG